jgi:hypothetical protein
VLRYRVEVAGGAGAGAVAQTCIGVAIEVMEVQSWCRVGAVLRCKGAVVQWYIY